ncbi:MAG: M15 family metallopeptidase [Acidimicrobiales bacterium]
MDRVRRVGLSSLLVTALVVASLVAPSTNVPAADAQSGGSTSLTGYWMVDWRGHVHAFGSAPHLGEGMADTVGMASTRNGAGYWLVTGDGTIVRRGSAPSLGPTPPLIPGERVVDVLADPSSNGAWIVTSRGAVHNRGGARAFGGTSTMALNSPIIAAVPTPAGDGYWLVAGDGGVFSFGAARFHGSMGGRPLNQPVMGLVPAPDGRGYWLVARDGGIFSFGSAPFHGSMGGVRLNRPVTGMVGAGGGYLMVASDGGVFAFGPGVTFHGSLGANPPPHDVVAIVPVPAGVTPPSPPANPAFVSDVRAVSAARMPASWRPGCPVGPQDLRVVTVDHWDMAGRMRSGEMVVHRDHAAGVVAAFRDIHAARFPIARMELIDLYGGSDDASMAANNTSAFNCRRVTGGTAWSEHAYGRAIDINPVQNPYVRGSTVLPPAGRDHLDRTATTPGLIRPGDAVTTAFSRIGWYWGGNWTSLKDYQHFSSTNR